MIIGIGVTLIITGLLLYSVVDNFKPECAQWKKVVINSIIGVGLALVIIGVSL